jgi:MerR family copper efflux transcriptional regulator
MSDKLLRIGEVAKTIGVSPDTIRHYEKVGVIPAIRRSDGGYRMYPPQTIARVMLVRNGLQFGFSLRQLAGFLKARDSGTAPCRQVRATAEAIVNRVEQRITELEQARASIRQTLKDWDVRLAAAGDRAPARLLDALPVRQPISRD